MLRIEGSIRKLIIGCGATESRGEDMLSTVLIVLAIWLGLNTAFAAIRFYVTADRPAHAEPDFVRYPRPVN